MPENLWSPSEQTYGFDVAGGLESKSENVFESGHALKKLRDYRAQRWWPATVALWIFLLTVAMGCWSKVEITEPLDGDAIGFLPQMIHFKQDGRLVNELYTDVFPYAVADDGRYVWHGILFPLITAA